MRSHCKGRSRQTSLKSRKCLISCRDMTQDSYLWTLHDGKCALYLLEGGYGVSSACCGVGKSDINSSLYPVCVVVGCVRTGVFAPRSPGQVTRPCWDRLHCSTLTFPSSTPIERQWCAVVGTDMRGCTLWCWSGQMDLLSASDMKNPDASSWLVQHLHSPLCFWTVL